MDNFSRDNSWREFQSEYIVRKKKREQFIRTVKSFMGVVTLVFLFAGIFFLNIEVPEKNKISASVPEEVTQPQPPSSPDTGKFSKEKLFNIFSKTDISKTDKNIFLVNTPKAELKVITSIDVPLQEYLLSLISQMKRLTRGKPQRIAFVVMEPDTGKIIAMTGYDLNKPDTNPCLESDYPAASIFKIVTAAAAVETLGYNPQTQLYFSGNKYTLYKGQVRNENKNKHSYQISFSSAFAESVNPIFGKIGKNHLGKEKLESYANAFGFNQLVHSELPFVSGNFETGNDEFHLAELGSGYNYDTTISPVFGAMLISGVVNQGKVMMPTIVEHVTDPAGDVIYKADPATYKSAITPKTAETMMQIMQKTITTGTARKSFRNASKDPVLSKLIMGGKTGSLNNREHTIKYDWFTGFGKEKNGDRTIAMAIVVGHGQYIGTKSSVYGNMILKQYFKNKPDTRAQL
ncbi:MAG: PbpA [Desulfobacterales bacterium RIFOXYA12_FULL_46_15]|nr:MAG: PbpA [Desulfobacterales bacterium RIFOXYA12_FULL_46_15]